MWGGGGESAANSWKFGSLSRGKTAKMAVNQYFRGESAANSRQIGSLSLKSEEAISRYEEKSVVAERPMENIP